MKITRYRSLPLLFALLATSSYNCAHAEKTVSVSSNVVQKLDAASSASVTRAELEAKQAPVPDYTKALPEADKMVLAQAPVKSPELASDVSTDSLSLDPIAVDPVDSDTATPSLRSSSLHDAQDLLSLPPMGYDTTTSSLDIDAILAEYNATTSTLGYEDTTGSISIADMYADPRVGDFKKELDSLTKGRNIKKLSLLNAVCNSLESNQSLRVSRLQPEISNTGIESAEGEFDTVVQAEVGYGSSRRSTLGPKPRNGPDNRVDDVAVSRNLDYSVGVGGRLPSGTDYSLSFSGGRSSSNSSEHFFSNDLNLNITQNLLRGAGSDVNLISVWTAQNNFVISLYQLQNTLINLVTDVQKAYWDVYLAYETLDIRSKAYQVAREQRERTEEFVRVGRSAPLDALAAQAEEASRISDIINSISNLKLRQLTLLRLINPENMNTGWRSLIVPNETPRLPSEKLVPEERVRLARYYRPDLRQAQIDLANGELEVYRTANGLLPQLDFVISAGLSGVGDSQGDSVSRMTDLDHRNYQVGLQFSYPLQNRRANAAHRRANFQKVMAEEAIRNYCQIIDVDVRTAILEIERTSRLIYSTQITEELRRKQLEAETEKFRVGRSTQIEVSQAQRDYVQSQLDTVTAKVANINAYLELYRVEGTALQRRGIQPIHITPESGVPAG